MIASAVAELKRPVEFLTSLMMSITKVQPCPQPIKNGTTGKESIGLVLLQMQLPFSLFVENVVYSTKKDVARPGLQPVNRACIQHRIWQCADFGTDYST